MQLRGRLLARFHLPKQLLQGGACRRVQREQEEQGQGKSFHNVSIRPAASAVASLEHGVPAQIIENQRRDGDPPETKQTHECLLRDGHYQTTGIIATTIGLINILSRRTKFRQNFRDGPWNCA